MSTMKLRWSNFGTFSEGPSGATSTLVSVDGFCLGLGRRVRATSSLAIGETRGSYELAVSALLRVAHVSVTDKSVRE